MRWFNANAAHNVINAIITVLASGALTGLDWTLFGIDDPTALKIVGVLSFLKLVMNAYRDGVKGMVAPQPPVEKP